MVSIGTATYASIPFTLLLILLQACETSAPTFPIEIFQGWGQTPTAFLFFLSFTSLLLLNPLKCLKNIFHFLQHM